MSEERSEQLRAYEAALYVVDPFGDESVLFELRVGQPSPDLDLLLEDGEEQVDCWAFITAFNPGSRRLPDEVNRAAQERLEARLAREGRAFWPGWGQSPDGTWREESVLVLGMSREDAVQLGRELGQVAVLFARVGGLVELVICGVSGGHSV